MVHGPVEAEGPAVHGGGGGVGDEGIARGGADAFADTVAQAQTQKLPRSGDQADQGAAENGHTVTGQDKALALARLVGPASGPELEQAGHGFSGTFDQAEVEEISAQNCEQKGGQERIDDLAGGVVQEAGGGQDFDIARHGRIGRRWPGVRQIHGAVIRMVLWRKRASTRPTPPRLAREMRPP